MGNEALDQLTKFNRALGNYSGVSKPRQIDGIILSKFDTVDDKVGAALSMTFVTGRPILFVGTGQTYTGMWRLFCGLVTMIFRFKKIKFKKGCEIVAGLNKKLFHFIFAHLGIFKALICIFALLTQK